MNSLRSLAIVALSLAIAAALAHTARALGAHVDLAGITTTFTVVLRTLVSLASPPTDPPQLPPGDDHHRLPPG